MNKPLTVFTTILMTCSLAACAKKINGQKVYKVDVASKTSQVSGKRTELIKIHGTTSAPDGYEIIAVNKQNKDTPVCKDHRMKKYVQVKHGKFTGFIDPLTYDNKVKKGNNLKYHFAAVKNVKNINQQGKKSIKQEFDVKTIKLKFDPTTEFVQSKVQKSLGSGAIVSKKSKTVFAITPKKDSNFENEVSESVYGDKDKWSDITAKINKLSKTVKTPAGRIALVLINPENHKKFLLVSIGGKAKVDSISSGAVNSNASNTANMKSSNAAGKGNDDDGDDFDLGVILGYLLAYDEQYGDDADDDSSYADYDDGNDYNYNDNNDYDDDSSNDQDNSSSSQQPADNNNDQNYSADASFD